METAEKGESVEKEQPGCKHYKRKCAFISPCCKKVYVCRVCHDDVEKHPIDRHSVQDIKCLICNTEQKVRPTCVSCEVKFGEYFCKICRLFDDADRQQFHCDGCGICRVGGRENFFHCTKCDVCLSIHLKTAHKCIEKASRSNCPVCLEDLHTSRMNCDVPKCGHIVHTSCMRDLLKSGNCACPLCGESLVEMSSVWKILDDEVRATPMPDEYKDYNVQILCKDCHKESRVGFHVVGLKCQHCGSYNTCRAAEPTESADANDSAKNDAAPTAAEASAAPEGDQSVAGPSQPTREETGDKPAEDLHYV